MVEENTEASAPAPAEGAAPAQPEEKKEEAKPAEGEAASDAPAAQ